MSFGVIAWLLYEKLSEKVITKRNKIILTYIEGILNITFFYAILFHKTPVPTLFSVLLLLPVIVAIAFSGRSYILKLFRFRWMKYMDSISLTIYLNHAVARRVVSAYFEGVGYKIGMVLFAFFIMMFCLIHFLLVKLTLFLLGKRS